MKKRLFIFLLSLFPIFLNAQTVPAHEYHLDNGMKVIVKTDSRSPTVLHMLWYRVGSMDEKTGKTGVAHVLEHLMFKGTKNIKDFSKRVAALGGQENAFTSKDFTAYYQHIGKDHLEAMMELEADRMVNLSLTDEEFKPEMNVIKEERRWRTDDRAPALLLETMNATAFVAHPYRTPVIGWMDDLDHMTLANAQEWYKQWYAPNNATMVVVGDVIPDEVFALAKKHFGKIPTKVLPERREQREPEQKGMRRIDVKARAENPYVMLAFKTPTLRNVEKDDDVYALCIL